MRAAVGLVWLAGVALAGTPVERLRAQEPREQAWGAYLAGAQGVQEAVPALRRLLASEDPVVRLSVLDALIQLEAYVGWQELEPLYRRHADPVLILLAQHPEAHRAALRGLVGPDTRLLHWYAACNLLAEQRDPGLAERLLSHLEVRLTVTVVDGEETVGVCGGCGTAWRGRQRVRVRDAWPPLTLYHLATTQQPGARLVASGVHPVYFVRRVVQGTASVSTKSPGARDRHADRLAYLARLLDTTPGELPVKRTRHATVHWTGAEAYRAEIARLRGELAADLAQLADALAARELLPGSRPAPRIAVEVADRRGDTTVRLPEAEAP